MDMNDLWSFVRLNAFITPTPTAAETSRLYALIAAKCEPTTLGSLTLHAYSPTTPLPVDLLAGAAITFDMLRPLFAFHAISVVSLEPPAGVSLDDASIEALSRRWPNLRSLHLLGAGSFTPFKISFDASVVPDGILLTDEKSGLACFDVDDAVLVDPVCRSVSVALFPGLKRVDQLDALWGEVDELHPTVWAATTADICFDFSVP
ncbi:hypothetical protein B0H14DRAFT_3501284 [Mycena olivaceomarginata]|nr:hypothetical protein B0H14DRAFT_3501284 [Mycena olivaceomarginata]